MSRDDENRTNLDVGVERHSADLLAPLTEPECRAVLDSLMVWCRDRTVSRSDVSDMIDFLFGNIDQEELVRRCDIGAPRHHLYTYLG